MSPPGLPDSALGSPGPCAVKPLPAFDPRLAEPARPVEVQLPPLIAGALAGAFARSLASALDNALLSHYYRADQAVPVNLDRVLDRLLARFTRDAWDELYQVYHDGPEPEPSRQVALLFDGPVRQLVLVLNGPETAKCVLDMLAPGLSQRRATWSSGAGGIDLPLALQLLCTYWHREKPSQSPGGSPDEIARSLHANIITGNASRALVAEMHRVLLSPHHVQMHVLESAVWAMLLVKRPDPPPADGFHAVQFKHQRQLFGPLDAVGDPQLVRIGSLPAITGTADECIYTSVADYVGAQWPRCGPVVLRCLEGAGASLASRHGAAASAMSVWDGPGEGEPPCAGLRLVHVDVAEAEIRMGVSARLHAMI